MSPPKKDGLRIVLELKAGADPELIMAYLYKHTSLQDTFSCNFTCLVPVPGQPEKPGRIGWASKGSCNISLTFGWPPSAAFRVRARAIAKEIHILEGFALILTLWTKHFAIIRQARAKPTPRKNFGKPFLRSMKSRRTRSLRPSFTALLNLRSKKS